MAGHHAIITNMNEITEPANQGYDFGHDFSYAQWSPNTTLTLCNVPWSNTYRDIVRFDSRAALNTYIDTNAGLRTVLENATLAKPNHPIYIDLPINVASRYNYIRATNPAMPVTGDVPRDYYYFVLGVEYHAPNTTMLVVELDVWSTYFTEIEFDRCYVERGHIGVANSKQWDDYGRKYLTIPEGFDLGAEYKPVNEESYTVFGTGEYDFLVTSSISLVEHPGTLEEPNLPASRGSSMAPFYLSTESYVIKKNDIIQYLTDMSQYSWIMQGIIEIRAIPTLASLGIPYIPISRYNSYPPGLDANDSYLNSTVQLGQITRNFNHSQFRNILENNIPSRYRHLKKFYTYPYSVLTMTTRDSNPVFYKPELFPYGSAQFNIKGTLVPGNQVLKAEPVFYNNQVGSQTVLGESRDYACVYDHFPSFPVLNNAAIIAMASQARSTAHAYESTDWAYARTMEAQRVSFDNQTSQIAAGVAQAELGRSVDQQGTDISNRYAIAGAASNVGMGVIGGAVAGGPAGAGIGAVGGVASAALQTGMSIARNNEELALRQSASLGSQNIQTGLSQTLRDNNAALAEYSARGDYESAVAGLNARVQDMQMTPPSLSGQLSGDFLKLLDGVFFQLVWKTLHDGEIERIGEIWLRYGYAVHKFLKPPTDLHCMTRFTYWKMTETYVTGNIPEFYKNSVRGIFEKGVTVWRNPTDIGNIDIANNTALSGIGY